MHLSTYQFCIVAEAPHNGSAHASPVLGMACITWASHRSRYLFVRVWGALSSESAHASHVMQSMHHLGRTSIHVSVWHGGWRSRVAGALCRKSAHASPVIGRACITWAMHRSTHQFCRAVSALCKVSSQTFPVRYRVCISCASHCSSVKFAE